MIKNLIGDLLGFNEEISNLKEGHMILVNDLEEKATYWNDRAEDYFRKYSKLNGELNQMSKPVDIPSVDISYRRPVLIGKKQFKMTNVDVRSFIMPDFTIENAIRDKGLMYNGNQDFEELVPKLYQLAKKTYKYSYDREYGWGDLWRFPFETRYIIEQGKGADCEDFSGLIGSFFAAARIPRSRWLVSVGTTRAGYGHSTIYAKDNSGKWRHLQSTKPDYKHMYLDSYPTNKYEGDKHGIKEDGFWFSFNDFFAINRWDSDTAKAAFLASDLPITIRRIRK